jgi:hypothetical protein
MKKRLLIFLAFSSVLFAQATGGSNGANGGKSQRGGTYTACGKPNGNLFSESFGDDAAGLACGFGGYTGCNNPWNLTSTGITIGTTPGSPPANTACSKSLFVDTTNATNMYITHVGSIPTMPAGTAWDMVLSITQTATPALAAFNAQDFVGFSTAADGVNSPCDLRFHTTTLGSVAVNGVGSTTSSDTGNLSAVGTWDTIRTHCQAGLRSSWVQLNSGTKQFFTANSVAANYLIIGPINGNVGASNVLKYALGYIAFTSDSVTGSGKAPFVYWDGEASTNTTVFSTTIAAQGTHGGNGSWTVSGAQTAGFTVSTSCQNNLLTPVEAGAKSYVDSGTRGVQFTMSTVGVAGNPNTYYLYSWADTPWLTSASYGRWVKIPATTASDFYSHGNIIDNLGSDFAGVMANNGQLYIETNGNPNGAPTVGSFYTYTANNWYWETIQFNTTGNHKLDVYDSTGTLVSHQEKTSTATGYPIGFELGFGGDNNQTNTGVFCFDNVFLDYVRGNMIRPNPIP